MQTLHQFYTRSAWDNLLKANAQGAGREKDFAALPQCFLDHLYHHGVPPTVNSVIAFCESDPEQWQDAQEEKAERIAALRQELQFSEAA